MKDIFSKIRQGLNLRATDLPARQETLASDNEEPWIEKEAELVSPPEVGSAPVQAPPTRKSFAFMAAAKEGQDASPRNSDATENVSRPHVDDRRPHKDPANPARPKKPTFLPGSDGEHALQVKYGAKDRALGFYGRQEIPRQRRLCQSREHLREPSYRHAHSGFLSGFRRAARQRQGTNC